VIDAPLYDNPLAGGSQFSGSPLSFRQEGDMGRYVADNDPGGIAAGFSNLSDFLAAGNKIPENRKNPYGTEFIGIGADQTNLFGYKVPDYVIKEQEERMKNNPIDMSAILRPGMPGYTPLAPIREGVSQDIFGEPNLLAPSDQRPVVDDASMKGLPETNEPPMFTRSVSPIVTGPQEIATQDATNPYNRVGQQLTGPNQDDILGTLKNIEQGIMSLGQGNMDQSSFGGFNNNFGIGSFFPPYGGMYGK